MGEEVVIDDIAKDAIKRKDDIIVFNGGKDIFFRDDNNNYVKESGEKLMYNGIPVSPDSFVD